MSIEIYTQFNKELLTDEVIIISNGNLITIDVTKEHKMAAIEEIAKAVKRIQTEYPLVE
jgi:hypothetical protein